MGWKAHVTYPARLEKDMAFARHGLESPCHLSRAAGKGHGIHLTWAGKPMALIPRGWKRTWHSPDMGWKAHGTYPARLEKDMAFT